MMIVAFLLFFLIYTSYPKVCDIVEYSLTGLETWADWAIERMEEK
jgi:hypothetical protein